MGKFANSIISMLILVAIMFAIFYFILIRPQKKRIAEHKKMLDSLKKGDVVITAGGILGTVVDVLDYYVILQIDKDVKIKMLKSQILALANKRGSENEK